jgi:hypothetical protein
MRRVGSGQPITPDPAREEAWLVLPDLCHFGQTRAALGYKSGSRDALADLAFTLNLTANCRATEANMFTSLPRDTYLDRP